MLIFSTKLSKCKDKRTVLVIVAHVSRVEAGALPLEVSLGSGYGLVVKCICTALAALAEDPELVSSTNIGQLTTDCNSSSW